ncbi:hypothetical protein C8J57DRAFT_1223534 [Mycena rebaudengoi]|nr:hypothetical protein C8J57DRAFT_1223534 [Mycena rebaudengoi]
MKYEDTMQKYFARTQKTGLNFSDETYSFRYITGEQQPGLIPHTAHKYFWITRSRRGNSSRPIVLHVLKISLSRWFGRRFTLTLENVNSGKTNVKKLPHHQDVRRRVSQLDTKHRIHGRRDILGRSNNTTDPDISALPTGNFLILSALLAEATSDEMYLQAAFEAAEFIHAHLYTNSHDVQYSISARQNDSCKVDPYTDPGYSALAIEGLLNDLITAIPDTIWQQGDGVLDKEHFDYPSDLVKALGVAYARNVTSPDLRNWMQACIGVQFNAVMDLSTNGNNLYAYSWHGPPSDTFNSAAQTDAIHVLLSALSVADNSQPLSLTSVSPSPTGAILPAPSTSASSAKLSMTGPIVGGVIGGIALLSSIIFVFWRLQGRSRRRNDAFATPAVTPMVIAPYTERPSSQPLSILSPRRAKINTAALSQTPTSGDQVDGAAPEGEAEFAQNTHRENSDIRFGLMPIDDEACRPCSRSRRYFAKESGLPDSAFLRILINTYPIRGTMLLARKATGFACKEFLASAMEDTYHSNMKKFEELEGKDVEKVQTLTVQVLGKFLG